MKQSVALLLCITFPLHPMVSKLWNMKSFVKKVEPAKDNLVAIADAEIKRLTLLKRNTQELLSATNNILQASIPIIQETGNFMQSKQLKKLTSKLKQLRTMITECTTEKYGVI